MNYALSIFANGILKGPDSERTSLYNKNFPGKSLISVAITLGYISSNLAVWFDLDIIKDNDDRYEVIMDIWNKIESHERYKYRWCSFISSKGGHSTALWPGYHNI